MLRSSTQWLRHQQKTEELLGRLLINYPRRKITKDIQSSWKATDPAAKQNSTRPSKFEAFQEKYNNMSRGEAPKEIRTQLSRSEAPKQRRTQMSRGEAPKERTILTVTQANGQTT